LLGSLGNDSNHLGYWAMATMGLSSWICLKDDKSAFITQWVGD